MEFDLNFTSNRQRKMFMRNPQAYLVKKASATSHYACWLSMVGSFKVLICKRHSSTGKTEEARKIWTYGVPELKQALGAEDHEVFRILKNAYGNSTAPRGLCEDVDRAFTELGGKRILGDSSFSFWIHPNPHPRSERDQFKTIGFVGGQVDDFNRAGNLECEEWLKGCQEIDKAYKWGTVNPKSTVTPPRPPGLRTTRSKGGFS